MTPILSPFSELFRDRHWLSSVLFAAAAAATAALGEGFEEFQEYIFGLFSAMAAVALLVAEGKDLSYAVSAQRSTIAYNLARMTSGAIDKFEEMFSVQIPDNIEAAVALAVLEVGKAKGYTVTQDANDKTVYHFTEDSNGVVNEMDSSARMSGYTLTWDENKQTYILK